VQQLEDVGVLDRPVGKPVVACAVDARLAAERVDLYA